MDKYKIGVLGTSEIAYRRFLPSVKKSNNFEYVGIASRNIEKTEKFVANYGGKAFTSYDELLYSDEVDAVYIPLPPELHYEWANKAIDCNKHVLLEKPFVTNYNLCDLLINKAKEKNIALHENYMFQFHNQLSFILNELTNKSIGDIRLIKISFGFPKRDSSDFRYNKDLGGGALLDCGGYTVKLATILYKHFSKCDIKVCTSNLNYDGYEVDLYGTATLINEEGLVSQLSFGMDNSYKCELEIWGSKGSIVSPRIFTAPPDLEPIITINSSSETQPIKLKTSDQFLGSIDHFYKCIIDHDARIENSKNILLQSKIIEQIKCGGLK